MSKATVTPAKADDRRVVRRDPFAFFDTMQDEMERLWGRMAPFGLRPLLRRTGEMPELWAPRLDVFEKDGKLAIKAELPGVKKEDVTITLEGENLIIRGERKSEEEVKEEDYYRMERSTGSFYRCLPLPFEAKAEEVEAHFADGVLEITMPRPTAAQPVTHAIAVN